MVNSAGWRENGAPVSTSNDVRIADTFARLRLAAAGLVTYDRRRSVRPARCDSRRADRAGVDILEVGVPFSDPLADGPVIQRAAERALAAGGSLRAALSLIEAVRADVAAPIVVFSYANPVLRMGIQPFAARAAAAGVDGVLVLDLPIEEAGEFREVLAAAGLDTIFLLSPTTTEARIRRAAELGRGFLYAISRHGVTGARDQVASGAEALVRRIRAQTSLPVALCFWIRPEHVAEVGACRRGGTARAGLAHRRGERLAGKLDEVEAGAMLRTPQ